MGGACCGLYVGLCSLGRKKVGNEPSQSGRVVKSTVLRSWVQALALAPTLPMLVDTSNGCKYVGEKGRAVILAIKRSAGVTPEVFLRNSTWARKHACKKSTLALKPRADITRSPKQGYVLQNLDKKKSWENNK